MCISILCVYSIQVARVPRIIHFMFRKTIAKKDRGKRKDEGGGRKKKAGGKGRETRKKHEHVGMEGKGRKINKKEGKGRKMYNKHGLTTICENNIAKTLSFYHFAKKT